METLKNREGKQAASSAPAVLDGTGVHSHDSNGLVHKLLSLPSFGKVVYRSNCAVSAKSTVSKQHAPSSALPKAMGLSSSQQMLLQGHASLGTRPPTLEFDSQFESGNLQKAVQASLYCSHHCVGQCRHSLGQCRRHCDGHLGWSFWQVISCRILPMAKLSQSMLHVDVQGCACFYSHPNKPNSCCSGSAAHQYYGLLAGVWAGV